jgi:spore coat protein SA
MKPRVYHVLTESEPFSACSGGAISRWVANIVAEDEDAVVIAPSSDGTWLEHHQVKVVPSLLHYRTLLHASRNHLPQRWAEILLRKILAPSLYGLRPGDIIWIHNRPIASMALAPIARQADAHIVLHLHNSHLVYYRGPLVADRLVFCSQYLMRESSARCDGVAPGVVIHNGADDAYLQLRPATVGYDLARPSVILFVGRLVPEKGVHVLIEAMRLLHQRHVQACARIVGDTAFAGHATSGYAKELERTAPLNVSFLGSRTGTSLTHEYHGADIFCCPSTWQEPFGMVNVEAMAAGLPVVASAVGGIPEVFRDGGALLVPPSDPARLAATLESLVANAELRRQLGCAGHESFHRHFRWSTIREQYYRAIESLAQL